MAEREWKACWVRDVGCEETNRYVFVEIRPMNVDQADDVSCSRRWCRRAIGRAHDGRRLLP